jgi:hypothetical protein
MSLPDGLTGEEIAAAVERWWGGELTREGFREALAFAVDERGPYPGKTDEEVVDFLERSYVGHILAEEAEQGLAFARSLAFAYLDQLFKRLAPATHAETIRSLPTHERHVYRSRPSPPKRSSPAFAPPPSSETPQYQNPSGQGSRPERRRLIRT